MVTSTKRFQFRKLLAVSIISLIVVLILFWLLAAGSTPNIYAAGPPVLSVEEDDHGDRFNSTVKSNDNPEPPAIYQQNNVPMYGPAVILTEDVGGSIIEMLPAYTGTSNILDIRFFSFDIIKEGNTYYLWLNSWVRAGAITDVLSKEQRFESRMGWSGATEPTPILATKVHFMSIFMVSGKSLRQAILMKAGSVITMNGVLGGASRCGM